jgi:hypothetical protein
MSSTSVFADIDILVVFESAKVAVSAGPLGTVAGVQFVAVFQSPEPGLRSQVAFPACAKPENRRIEQKLISVTPSEESKRQRKAGK